jgi:hypothetical protein
VSSSCVVAAAAGRTIGAVFCTGDGARAAAVTMAAMESNVSFVMLPLLSIVWSWSI